MRLTWDDVYKALEGPLTPNNGGTGKEASLSSPAPPLSTVVGAGGAFTGVSTDTRTLQPGDLFVALSSPKMDGHQFVAQALASGAAGLVVSQPVEAPETVAVFRVPDTQVAYGQLARFWRDQFDIPVIGVTGSVGKTTTKEMLAAALSPLGPVLKTEASQNNETGVPKALLQLNETHKAAVVEMGMRGPGQIAYLCGIARPTVGVITLIGENHIELLGSQDAIAGAKGELLEALPDDGVAVLNGDDPYYDRLRAKTEAHISVYQVDRPLDPIWGKHGYKANELCRLKSGWTFGLRGMTVRIGSHSRHDIGNALAALAVADALGVPLLNAATALHDYRVPPMRMQVIELPNGVSVVNDAYNAAPASVKSALMTLKDHEGGDRIAFLGDMKELGEIGPEAHRALGDYIAKHGCLDVLYAVGELAAQIPGVTECFADSEQAAQFAREKLTLHSGDVILVKGSRAMAMERIVEALTARGAEAGPHGH